MTLATEFLFDMTKEDAIEFMKNFEPYNEFETTLQYEKIDISDGIDIHKTCIKRMHALSLLVL